MNLSKLIVSALFLSLTLGTMGIAGEGSGAGPIEHTDFQLPDGVGAVLTNPKYIDALKTARAALPSGYELYLNDGTVFKNGDGSTTVWLKFYRNIPFSGCLADYHGMINAWPSSSGLEITFVPAVNGPSNCH